MSTVTLTSPRKKRGVVNFLRRMFVSAREDEKEIEYLKGLLYEWRSAVKSMLVESLRKERAMMEEDQSVWSRRSPRSPRGSPRSPRVSRSPRGSSSQSPRQMFSRPKFDEVT